MSVLSGNLEMVKMLEKDLFELRNMDVLEVDPIHLAAGL